MGWHTLRADTWPNRRLRERPRRTTAPAVSARLSAGPQRGSGGAARARTTEEVAQARASAAALGRSKSETLGTGALTIEEMARAPAHSGKGTDHPRWRRPLNRNIGEDDEAQQPAAGDPAQWAAQPSPEYPEATGLRLRSEIEYPA